MFIILEEEKATPKKKKFYYKYSFLFGLIKKILKLVEYLQSIDKYLTYGDEETIRTERVKEFDNIIRKIEKDTEYARKRAEQEKGIWETGKIEFPEE